MSESLSSFLITVSLIVALALFVPCIEALVRLARRAAKPVIAPSGEAAPGYSREVA
jgi:hypothetical protein